MTPIGFQVKRSPYLLNMKFDFGEGRQDFTNIYVMFQYVMFYKMQNWQN